MSLVGAAVKRKEDPNLLVGRATFVDDLAPAGTAIGRFVRSTEAHATIVSIDTSIAAAMPGVLAVVTIDDLASLPMIPGLPPEVAPLHRPLLAPGVVRFVGEPVAVVVAAWFLNIKAKSPVMPMSLGAIAALGVGFAVNVMALVGLNL